MIDWVRRIAVYIILNAQGSVDNFFSLFLSVNGLPVTLQLAYASSGFCCARTQENIGCNPDIL